MRKFLNQQKMENMSKKIENFIKAFVSLTPVEKKQIVEIINALNGVESINESKVIKSFGLEVRSNAINFAPTPGSCPTCGR